MIKRPYQLDHLSIALKRAPITALLGPRQCGKTTLAHMFTDDLRAVFFDLESQPDLQRLQNPELMLGSLDGIVVIDEVQIMPELFKVLRVLVDRPALFLERAEQRVQERRFAGAVRPENLAPPMMTP